MLHHACQTTPESIQTVKMCNVSKQSTTASQAKAKSSPPPSTPTPSPIPKQYCRNYQSNNCRRSDCRYLHETDSSFNSAKPTQSITKDNRSENRSVKQASGNNRSSNYKSNNSNKRNNNRANDNSNNASMSNSNSGPSHARLNRLQAQEDDFQSWSNVNSQGYRNASLNTLSFKCKRLHREAAIEEERQKDIEWDINNSPGPRSRRRRNRRDCSESTKPSPQPSSTHDNIIVPTTVADAISIPYPVAHIHIDVPAATIFNYSAADAFVDEETNDDTSTGRRSVNSNETH